MSPHVSTGAPYPQHDSTSELGRGTFWAGGHPAVASEAVTTVSWKGPEAGQGPPTPRLPSPLGLRLHPVPPWNPSSSAL